MDPRAHLGLLALALAGCASAPSPSPRTATESAIAPADGDLGPPSLVLVVADDLPREAVSAYGDGVVLTPAVDRVADAGVLYERAFSLDTRPLRTMELWSLLEVDYQVAGARIGWFELGQTDEELGVGELLPRALAFLEESAEDERPFLLVLGTVAPAGPGEDESLPARAHTFDRTVGLLDAALEETGRADDTLFVLTSTRRVPPPGTPLEQQRSDPALGVPLIVRWPARLPAGTRSGRMLFADRFAVPVVTKAGFDPAGRDLAEALAAELLRPPPPPSPLELGSPLRLREPASRTGETVRDLRTERYELLTRGEEVRLYDLGLDPAGTVDVSTAPAYDDILRILRATPPPEGRISGTEP